MLLTNDIIFHHKHLNTKEGYIMNIVITIALLFVLAVITHHLVAWAGSVLYSVDNAETLYAVFTFHDDRNQPMTTNILMNVCIPNVFMLFIFMAATKLQLHNIEKYLIWYVVLFYFYRSFLICVILRRKEMYSYLYELCMAAAGILLAVFLNNLFLVTETTIFITAYELREELWFAILVILFQFVKQILDKKVVQNTVLSKGQLTRYIIHKFEKFYKKYNDLLQITHVNRYMYIFLYSIMIFEDYNRGPIVRTIERMKIRLGKRATVGIMQMQSDIPLTDRESIIRFYAWLERNVEDSELLNPYDEYYIKDLAWKHNHDDAYANSVLYIFNCLYQYIDEVPKYRMAFHLREEVESQSSIEANIVRSYTTYSCEDMSTFLHCIGNDTYIRLPEGHLNLPDYAQLSPHPFAIPISDGWALIISDIANMYICGMDTVVKTAYENTNVLTFQNCEYIVLDHSYRKLQNT